MERLQYDIIPLIDGFFYYSPMERSKFQSIPSMKDVELYDTDEFEGLYDYIVLYARNKISMHGLRYIEEKECYVLEDDVEIEPDFYIKKLEGL